MGNMRMLAGKCLCGAVQYSVPDDFRYAINCHCSNCRRTTGSAFKPIAGIERDKLVVTHGVDDRLVFGGETNNDTHCARCGSLLFSNVRDGAFVHVPMGTLVDAPTIRPSCHSSRTVSAVPSTRPEGRQRATANASIFSQPIAAMITSGGTTKRKWRMPL